MAKNIQHSKIVYPPLCKELAEDVGKDELIRRLKVSLTIVFKMNHIYLEIFSATSVLPEQLFFFGQNMY